MIIFGITGCTIKNDFDGADASGVKYLPKNIKQNVNLQIIILYRSETIDLLSESLNNFGISYDIYYYSNIKRNIKELENIKIVSSFEDFIDKANIEYFVTIKASEYPGRKIIESKLTSHIKELKEKIPNLYLYFLVIPDDRYDYYIF